MAEKIFSAQRNYGWGLTLNMTGKAPAVSKRIFDTYADALAYANDVKDSAIEGLVLSVVADTNAALNGVYFVQQAASEAVKANDAEGIKAADAKEAILVKLGSEANANGGIAGVEGKLTQEIADRQAADKAITDSIGTVAEGKTVMGTITEEVGKLNTAISNEQTTRENAFNTLKGKLGDDDATTLAAINDELDAIDAKIGDVPTNKTVVGMIADAETAAKAAATKMKLADNEELLTLSHTTDAAGAITYTLGTNNVASDAELQTEIDRAVAAEGRLQAQIGKAATEQGGPTGLHKEIADAIDALDANVDSTGGSHVTVHVTEANGVISAITVSESDIASANDLTAETTARTDADTALANRLTKIEGDEQTVGSIKKAVADAKAAIEGTLASTDAKTLAALNDRIDDVITDAKTYSIAKATKSEVASLGTNVKEAYKLVDEDKVRVGEFIPVYKDSSLKSAVLNGQKLVFTYTLADETEEVVEIDVSTFLAESEFKDGLQVVDHVVSVKRDAASEGFLTVSANGVKLSGVQSAIDTAKKAVTDRLDIIEGEETVKGSIKKALKDAKTYTDTEIVALNATAGTQNVSEGKHVAVEVVETAGKLTSLVVTEDDIASAASLTAEISRATSAETALDGRLDVIEGDGVGSINKAVSDAKDSIISGASSDYNTLGKLEQKVKDVDAAAKAAATKLVQDNEGHVTVSGVQDQTTNAWTYTISENDIASAQALAAETQTRASEDTAIKGRLDVLEGVTVTGENAITVSESDAKKSKKVSLKLGTQPAEGVAGIVLSQNADGLVAKLYWGTF